MHNLKIQKDIFKKPSIKFSINNNILYFIIVNI